MGRSKADLFDGVAKAREKGFTAVGHLTPFVDDDRDVLGPNTEDVRDGLHRSGAADASSVGENDGGSVDLLDRNEVHLRGAEEACDELICREGVEFDGRSDLLDASVAQDHYRVGHGHRLDLVVGHVDHSRAQPLMQRDQFAAHLDPKFGIQIAERLVEQEGLGFLDDGAADGDTLALPTGQLVRRSLEE